MTSEARKISIVQDYLRTDNEEILKAVEDFFYKTKAEVLEANLEPMSLNEYNNEIDKAIDDETNDRIISVEQLKKRIEKWS